MTIPSSSFRTAGQPGLSLRRARGFTLVELMITLAIAAILVSIAAPSMRNVLLSSSLNSSANAVVDSINLARLNAIKLNAPSQFCGNTAAGNTADTLGAACGTTAGAVYELPQAATTAGLVQSAPAGLAGPMQIKSLQALRFSGEGFAYQPGDTTRTPFTNTVAILCSSKLSSGNQRVITMSAGSVIAVTTSTGSCS